MSEKEMVGVRLPNDVIEELEEYAEERDISQSDAIRRMIKKGLDLDNAGLSVTASDTTRAKQTGTILHILQVGLLFTILALLLV